VISLEQVQLLEAKVAKAIEYVQTVTTENNALSAERTGLQAKLESYRKRIDELEVLIMRFKEDQSRIEDGIIAALDRLNQFEEAFENSLKDNKADEKKAAVKQEKTLPLQTAKEIESSGVNKPQTEAVTRVPPNEPGKAKLTAARESKEFFEIPETEPSVDHLMTGTLASADEELDIF